MQVASTRFYLVDLGWSEKLEGVILTVFPGQLEFVLVEIHHFSNVDADLDGGPACICEESGLQMAQYSLDGMEI
jgi:hypothetical protein